MHLVGKNIQLDWGNENTHQPAIESQSSGSVASHTNPGSLHSFPLQSHVAYAKSLIQIPPKVPGTESYFLPLQDHVPLIVKSAEDLI